MGRLSIITSSPGAARKWWDTEPGVTDWESFVGWIKDGGVDGGKYDRPYVPASFINERTRRLNVNLVSRHVLTLDADHAGADYLEHLADDLLMWKALSHTTASHDEGDPRWRTLVPVSRPMTPQESKTVSTWLINLIGPERFDKSASTSPVAVAYAPAWEGVRYVEHDGPVLDVDHVLAFAPLIEWSAGDAEGALTFGEFLAEHEVTDLDDVPSCAYGRAALDKLLRKLKDTPEGTGVHSALYHAACRFVVMVRAGCWSVNDLPVLQEAAVSLRSEPRPSELYEAITSALKREGLEDTACNEHGPSGLEALEALDELADLAELETVAEERFPVLDLVGLLDPNRPPRQWVLEDVVPKGDQMSIVAPGGTGKSLLVLAMCMAAVSGEETFLGRKINFEGRVIYIDMENSEDDWAERLSDLGWTQETIGEVTDRFLPLSLPPLAGLDTAQGAQQLKALLRAHEVGEGDLLVLDSTQRVTEGPENDSDTLRSLYTRTSSWLKAAKITVIRTDNTGKDVTKGARGTAAKIDDVGYSLLLEPLKGEGRFQLTNAKHRSKGGSEEIKFIRGEDAHGKLTFTLDTDTDASDDFADVMDVHKQDTLLILWELTNPDGRNWEGDAVSRATVLQHVTGKNEILRNGVKDLVTEGYIKKHFELLKNGEESKQAKLMLSEQGKEWIAEQGEDWIKARSRVLSTRWEGQ